MFSAFYKNLSFFTFSVLYLLTYYKFKHDLHLLLFTFHLIYPSSVGPYYFSHRVIHRKYDIQHNHQIDIPSSIIPQPHQQCSLQYIHHDVEHVAVPGGRLPVIPQRLCLNAADRRGTVGERVSGWYIICNVRSSWFVYGMWFRLRMTRLIWWWTLKVFMTQSVCGGVLYDEYADFGLSANDGNELHQTPPGVHGLRLFSPSTEWVAFDCDLNKKRECVCDSVHSQYPRYSTNLWTCRVF